MMVDNYNKFKETWQIYSDSDYEETADGKLFTELDSIEIIDSTHNFIHFLNGFCHNMLDINIIHGWYHKTSGIVKFIIRTNKPDIDIFIHFAWENYMKNKKEEICDISIYYIDCSRLYKSEFDTDNNIFYKMFIKKLIDKIDD